MLLNRSNEIGRRFRRKIKMSKMRQRQSSWEKGEAANVDVNGWNPELVFLTEVFSNSALSAELITNTSVFETLFTL